MDWNEWLKLRNKDSYNYVDLLAICEQIFNGGIMMLANLPPTKEERKEKCVPELIPVIIDILIQQKEFILNKDESDQPHLWVALATAI